MFLVSALRRSQLSPIRRNIVTLRSVVARPSSRTVNLQTSCLKRFETTKTTTSSSSSSPANTGHAATLIAPGKPTPQKSAIPERVCIYHIGMPRVTILALLRVSTVFMFMFFTFVATPIYIINEGLTTNVLKVAITGLIPFLFVAYTTSPFVTWVHLRVPPFARQTQEALARYATSLPRNTELEMTTMNFLAKPRVSKVNIEDLRPGKQRWFGFVSVTRDTAAEDARRKWYMPRAIKDFSLETNVINTGKGKGGWVEVAKAIKNRKS